MIEMFRFLRAKQRYPGLLARIEGARATLAEVHSMPAGFERGVKLAELDARVGDLATELDALHLPAPPLLDSLLGEVARLQRPRGTASRHGR